MEQCRQGNMGAVLDYGRNCRISLVGVKGFAKGGEVGAQLISDCSGAFGCGAVCSAASGPEAAGDGDICSPAARVGFEARGMSINTHLPLHQRAAWRPGPVLLCLAYCPWPSVVDSNLGLMPGIESCIGLGRLTDSSSRFWCSSPGRCRWADDPSRRHLCRGSSGRFMDLIQRAIHMQHSTPKTSWVPLIAPSCL